MAKWGKKLLGLAAIGGAAAGLVYYLKSKEELDLDDFDDELDDDDFDLDNDCPITVNLEDDGCKLFCLGDNDYKRFLKEKSENNKKEYDHG